ncbi:MAG TPA: 16S rRNA (uracil(1498)-N(3))-methyltransferase [Bacteroidales bacterium]|nr:16S rRNA (uracil(1498)-N(3))-methyltransferase [Bacteroidales bacterium]
MHIFYLPEAAEGAVMLSEEESKHAVRVLRLVAGDQVHVTDGKGNFYKAVLGDAHPKRTVLMLGKPLPGNDRWPFYLHLALAPTKNLDRMEWFVEKATEIGVDEISFFHSAHSERRSINLERISKICVSAMKQSLKSRLPKLNVIIDYEQFIAKSFAGQRFIAWIDDGVQTEIQQLYQPGADCVILIGPEGDFNKTEVEAARKLGFEAVSLGQARLRTETAALVSVQTIQLLNRLK